MTTDEYRFTHDWPYHISCGGVVYRFENGEMQVLVLVRHGGGYDIPKGTLHVGETLEQCALREAEEESGQKTEIVGYLGGRFAEWVDKHTGIKISKITHYFAFKWADDTGAHDHEYDGVEWMPLARARRKLTPSSAEVVRRLVQFAEAFPGKL